MPINLLCIGDIVGRPGRRILSEGIAQLRAAHDIHCTIANVENTASGSGLTPSLYNKLVEVGVQLMTMGDHVYRRKAIIPVLERSDNIVRPANLPPGAPGREVAFFTTGTGQRVACFSLLGRMFMRLPGECPFRTADRLLAGIPDDVKIVVVDVHAEATSEKIALGWHLAGRVSVVFGTHTHVPTADECILPGGTAYITDLGMTGPYDSVLGRRKDRVIGTMISAVPSPFDVAEGDPRLCGIVASVSAHTGKAESIRRVCVEGNAADSETATDASSAHDL